MGLHDPVQRLLHVIEFLFPLLLESHELVPRGVGLLCRLPCRNLRLRLACLSLLLLHIGELLLPFSFISCVGGHLRSRCGFIRAGASRIDGGCLFLSEL